MEWETIGRLIRDGDHRRLTAALLQLTPLERRGFVAPLKAAGRTAPARWEDGRQQITLALAGAAILPNASTLAPWLRRHELMTWGAMPAPADPYGGRSLDVTDDVVAVLVARDVPWLADLAARLAARLPARRVDRTRHSLVDRLLELTDAPPPDTDGYLLGAVQLGWRGGTWDDRARADPRFAALVPRLFDLDVVGSLAGWGDSEPLARLVAERVVDRGAVLDAALARLQRPGGPGQLRQVTTVLGQLDPTPDELAARTRDLLAIVPTAPSPVVGVVQAHLAALSAAGRLDRATELEAATVLLARPEKKIVRAAVTHLGRLADREPDFAAAAAPTVVTAFAHAAVDLQRGAVDLLAGWTDRLDPAARAAVAAAAVDLPADLRARVEGRLTVAVPSDAPAAAALPPVTPTDAVRPAAEPTELVDLLRLDRGADDAVALERALEGLVRWSRPGSGVDLRAVLRPVLNGHRYRTWSRGPTHDGRRAEQVAYAVDRVVAAAVGDPGWSRRRPGTRESAAHTAVLDRIEGLADDLRQRPGPLLVSWPSTATGAIAVTDLLDRLRVAATEGWEPWPADLTTTLLRLDHTGTDPDDFDALGTAAGARVAAVLRAGPPTATSRAVWCERTVPAGWWSGDERPPDEVEPALLAAVTTSEVLHGELAAAWRRWAPLNPPARTHRLWRTSSEAPHLYAALLPLHRDVAAAHLAEAFRGGTAGKQDGGDVVATLAAADGPVGDATHLVLAYALGAGEREVRAAATDALLLLASRGDVDTTRLGELIGALCTNGELAVTRVVGPLHDAAVSGAASFLWPAVSALVTTLAGAPDRGTRFGDVLALAAEVAELAGAAAEPLGLARFAERSGRSRAVVEARRLRAVLGGASAPAAAPHPPKPSTPVGRVVFDGDVEVAGGVLVVDSGVGGRDERYDGPRGQRNGLVDVAQPGLLAVVTGSDSGLVRIRVELLDAAPAVFTDADEVVEVSCDLRGPQLRLGADGAATCTAEHPGPHRVRVSTWGLEAGREIKPRRSVTGRVVEHHVLQLWPARPAADVVVRTSTATGAYRHADAAMRPHPGPSARDIAVADRGRYEQQQEREQRQRLWQWGGREPTPELTARPAAAHPVVGLDIDLAHRVAALDPAEADRFAVEIARDACARDVGSGRDWRPSLAALAAGEPLPPDDPALRRRETTGMVTFTSIVSFGAGEPEPRQPLAADVAARAAVLGAADPDPITAALRALHAASWSVTDLGTWLPHVHALARRLRD